MRTTIIGVDLATKAIQVCVYLNSKVLSNKELTSQQFRKGLFALFGKKLQLHLRFCIYTQHLTELRSERYGSLHRTKHSCMCH